MKQTLKGLAAALAMALAATAGHAAETKTSPEHKFEKAVGYYTQCKNASRKEFEDIKPYLRAFTDSEVMAETVNDPEKFFKLMEIINDPRTIHVMMNCSTEPVMWDTWMRGLTDGQKLMSAAVKMMRPDGMVKWMMSPMNPKIWLSMMQHMDPNRYTRWAVAMGNPDFYKPLTDFFDPQWYEPRLAWLGDPKSYAPLAEALSISSLTAQAPGGKQDKPAGGKAD